LFDDFGDVGGLQQCSDAVKPAFVLWFVLCYLGEPGGYGMGSNRPVFYSNSAAPRIERIFSRGGPPLIPFYENALKDPRVAAALKNKYIARRAEHLMDLLQEKEET
jgi:hypothetical protein